jgi:hypothetical protein
MRGDGRCIRNYKIRRYGWITIQIPQSKTPKISMNDAGECLSLEESSFLRESAIFSFWLMSENTKTSHPNFFQKFSRVSG